MNVTKIKPGDEYDDEKWHVPSQERRVIRYSELPMGPDGKPDLTRFHDLVIPGEPVTFLLDIVKDGHTGQWDRDALLDQGREVQRVVQEWRRIQDGREAMQQAAFWLEKDMRRPTLTRWEKFELVGSIFWLVMVVYAIVRNVMR